MKVLVLIRATPNSEKGVFPTGSDKLFAQMGKFNEQLVKAGIMQGANGLKPSSMGKRIKFSDSGASLVIDGPFVETKELIAGYWLWDVQSVDEAVEWARRCPNPMPGEEGMLEIRPCYSLEELRDIVPPAEFEREARLRQQVARRQERQSAPARKVKPKTKSAGRKSAKHKRGRARGK
jgi:hypothetical protein